MRFVDVCPEVIKQSADQGLLSGTRDDADRQARCPDLTHQIGHSVEDRSRGHLMEKLRLQVVHLLCLGLGEQLSLLLTGEHADRVNAFHPLGGVCVSGSHVNPERRHGLSPGLDVVGHGVIEHAVHVKKHGFGAECAKAVPVKISFYFLLKHHSQPILALIALLSAS